MSTSAAPVEDRAPEPCNDFVGGLSTESATCPRCLYPIHEHPPEPWVVEWLEDRIVAPITDLYAVPPLPAHLRGPSI